LASKVDRHTTTVLHRAMGEDLVPQSLLDPCILGALKDFDHMFYHGLLCSLHNLAHLEIRALGKAEKVGFLSNVAESNAAVIEFRRRVYTTEWPTAVTVPRKLWGKDDKVPYGKGITMAMYRLLTIACFRAYEDLIPDDLYRCFVLTRQLSVHARNPAGLSVPDIKLLQRDTIALIAHAKKDKEMLAVFNRPNGGSLVHMVFHGLSIIRNGNLTGTARLERGHQDAVARRKGVTDQSSNIALKDGHLRDGAGRVANGMTWGPSYEYTAGEGLREPRQAH
jgi:hypothetical protein